jgi:cellulose synthase/poly-beta-1,6-N-acetylglucosamine synthase-like glycosyltransferase
LRRAENEQFADRRRGDPAHRASVVALHLVHRARAVPVRRRLSACPELDCVRHRLAPDTIAAVERRALELGVGADRVLIAARAITEDAYVVALAAALRVPYEPLDRLARGACPLTDAQLIDADKNGLLPLEIDGELVWIIAPRGLTARRLIAGTHPIPPRWMRLTSARRLRQFVIRHCGEELAQRAANGLRSVKPELSAASHGRGPSIGWVIAAATLAIVAAAFPRAVAAATSAALAFTFLAWTGLRMLGAVTAWQRWRPTRLWPGELPVYTIIVALYDEADAAAGLIAALGRLDYPPEKLDIKLVLEPDDLRTRAALDTLNLGASFEIIMAPESGPRTKPKALNTALALARGTFTAVFDAEDRPAPDQLHRALDVFLAEGGETACVQARLTVDNTGDGWLARLFTAEYAGLFDVLLPGLAQRRLPLPLGGSSNHFRTDALCRVGGWDAYNVTEDADLGMRLARFGYRTAVIGSTTYEEAPACLAPWLRQRTRWFKGWMQTWAVHMRQPFRLARALGFAGFATFQLVVGGTVLAALVHPLFIAMLLYGAATGGIFPDAEDLAAIIFFSLFGATLAAGYLTSAALGLIGLARRRLLGSAWVLALMPLHWLLLSIAAWRALYQLVRDPYLWEKTAHGLARTSRLDAEAGAARVTIFRSSGADRRPSPRAAA